MQAIQLPIWNHRTQVGQAATAAAAKRAIRKSLGLHPDANLRVWRRLDVVAETQGLPHGWVYSVSFGAAQ